MQGGFHLRNNSACEFSKLNRLMYAAIIFDSVQNIRHPKPQESRRKDCETQVDEAPTFIDRSLKYAHVFLFIFKSCFVDGRIYMMCYQPSSLHTKNEEFINLYFGYFS